MLELPPSPLIQGRQAACLPARFGRVELERRAAELSQPEWLVDGGLVPRGEGVLLGQHTLLRPGLELGPAPPPLEVEQQLRQELAVQAWGAPLAALPGCLRQAAVAFCSEGLPLVGPLADAPGLWMFTGFSAGFGQVPVLAPLLAQVLVSGGAQAEAATRRLQQLGVWLPDQAGAPGSGLVTREPGARTDFPGWEPRRSQELAVEPGNGQKRQTRHRTGRNGPSHWKP